MKAISLWQPYASLWLSPAKVHETRGWGTSYRGELLVHAAKRAAERDDDLDALVRKYGLKLPTGGIIGVLTLVDCRQMKHTRPENEDDLICGYWSNERLAWKRGAFRMFERPIPYRGMQGLFDVPDTVWLEHGERA